MRLRVEKILASLTDAERDFVEADAAALGVTMAEYMTDAFREGLAHAVAELGIGESTPIFH